MSLTYNVYTSNSLEGVYTKIKDGITSLNTTLEATNPNFGEIKYVRVSAVNEYGESFLSQAIKTIFIGKSTIEIISSFKNGYFVEYTKGNYATQKTLKKSTDGTTWVDVKTDTTSSTFTAIENITTPIYLKTTSSISEGATIAERDSNIIERKIPQTLNLAYASNTAMVVNYSSDGGATWNSSNVDISSNIIYCDNNICLGHKIGTGLFRSDDGGKNWYNTNNFKNGIYSNLLYLGNGKALIFGYNTGKGIHISMDFGLTWETLLPDGVYSSPIYLGHKIILVSKDNQFIMRSSDGGITWNNVLTTKNAPPLLYIGSGIVLASVYSVGIYRSVDYGLTWDLVDANGFFVDGVSFNNKVITQGSGRLKVSYDYGLTFESLSSVTFNNSSYVPTFIGNNTFLFGSSGIQKSTDGGITWSTIALNNAFSSAQML